MMGEIQNFNIVIHLSQPNIAMLDNILYGPEPNEENHFNRYTQGGQFHEACPFLVLSCSFKKKIYCSFNIFILLPNQTILNKQ